MQKEEKEILFGTLLGDSNLQTYTGGKTWRARFIQSNAHKDYLFHLYDIFKPIVKTSPRQSWLWLESGESRWTFNTSVLPLDLEFGKIFYLKNKKIVPSNEYLDLYLTPRAIAYWFMDDGSLKSNCKAYILCTDSFKLDDLKRIGEIFKNKYDIKISFHKQRLNYRIYIPRKEYNKFKNLIEEYVHPSMKYKL